MVAGKYWRYGMVPAHIPVFDPRNLFLKTGLFGLQFILSVGKRFMLFPVLQKPWYRTTPDGGNPNI